MASNRPPDRSVPLIGLELIRLKGSQDAHIGQVTAVTLKHQISVGHGLGHYTPAAHRCRTNSRSGADGSLPVGIGKPRKRILGVARLPGSVENRRIIRLIKRHAGVQDVI